MTCCRFRPDPIGSALQSFYTAETEQKKPEKTFLSRNYSELQTKNLRKLEENEKAKTVGRQILEVAARLPEEDWANVEDKNVHLARPRILVGEPDAGVRRLERLLHGNPQNRVQRRAPVAALAEGCAEMGRARECVALLRRLRENPTSTGFSVWMLQADPTWDTVRKDAAFKALLAEPKYRAPF